MSDIDVVEKVNGYIHFVAVRMGRLIIFIMAALFVLLGVKMTLIEKELKQIIKELDKTCVCESKCPEQVYLIPKIHVPKDGEMKF